MRTGDTPPGHSGDMVGPGTNTDRDPHGEDGRTDAERWLDRTGMDDGQVWQVPGHDPGVRIDLLLDGTLEREGWPEDVLALQPEARVEPTTLYVGDERSPRDGYLWPDGSGIILVGTWWDLVDMSRKDPAHRSESGEPVHREAPS